jgi:diguanylate cyclase (GGDEF)-like protein
MPHPLPPKRLSTLLMRYISQSENGVAVLDANDVFLYHNPAFARMFGLAAESMIDHSLTDMLGWLFEHRSGTRIAAQTAEQWCAFIYSLHRSAPFRSFEVDLIEGRWLLLTEQVHDDGEIILLCSDITKQKRTEQALRQAHTDLEQQALTDELTGLPNRRHFLKHLEQEFARVLRYQRRASLVMLDLDHFKQINDHYGHDAGDQVLRHFAGLLRSALRTGDFAGRLGGEEFALLLPETPLDGAMSVLERVRAALARATLDQVAPDLKYDFSGGVSELIQSQPVSHSQWLIQADQALYRAKNNGRGRTAVF